MASGAGLLAVAGAAVAATWVWTSTDIGYPGKAAFVFPVALNDHGVVAAYNGNINDPEVAQAFLSAHGRIRLLNVPGSRYVRPSAIDDAGDVLGIARLGGPASARGVAVVWRPSSKTPRTVSDPTGRIPRDAFLNDRDQVAFDQLDSAGNMHVSFAVLFRGGGLRATRLPTLGGKSATVTGLSDQGIAIGQSVTSSGGDQAVSWQDGKITDLGTVGGRDSYPAAINNHGLIVGRIQTRAGIPISAAEWKNGRLIDLGRFGARRAAAVAVNSGGDVLVQTFGEAGTGSPRGAVLVRADGETTRIPSPFGRNPITVTALNDRDQILGFGNLVFTRRSFVWQNGKEALLPTVNDKGRPYGSPVSLNNVGQALGIDYYPSREGYRPHGVIWQQH